MEKSVLSIDIGTSSIKAGIINNKGVLVSWGRAAYNEVGGSVEHWKTEIWIKTLEKLLKRISGLNRIEAVVVSGNGPTLVPVYHDGSYSDESLLWIDRKKVYRSGAVSFYLPSIIWEKENNPAGYDKTCCFLPVESFISYLLTGSCKVALPSREFGKYIWEEGETLQSGLDPDKLPPFTGTGDLIGNIKKDSSEKYGLKSGLPVFAGGSDYLMALLGSGAVYPGAVCDRAGTSEGINYCSKVRSEYHGLRCLPHIIEGYYNISAILTSSGRIFEWFRKISGQEGKNHMELLAEIQKVINIENGLYFFPSLKKGSVWDFSGGAMIGLEPEHGIPEAGSAVVKSIGFAVRNLIELMEGNGLPIDNIRVSGGQARNTLWNQMKADMTGKNIMIPEIYDGELLGSACAGFKGLGVFRTLFEGSEKLVRIKDVYKPDKALYDNYSKLYSRYSVICEKVTTLFLNISEM